MSNSMFSIGVTVDSSMWSDDNPVAQCVTQKMPSLDSVCGDIGASDTDMTQSDGMYTEVLLDWLEWWNAETRERVLLDSDLSKPGLGIDLSKQSLDIDLCIPGLGIDLLNNVWALTFLNKFGHLPW